MTSSDPKSADAVLADPSLAEVHEQDAPLVHHAAQVEAAAGLADDGPEDRLAEELADLVLDRVRWPPPGTVASSRRTPSPRRLRHHWIAEPLRDHLAVAAVAQQPLKREERRAGDFQQCQQRVAEDVLQPRAPTVAVEFLEGGDDRRRPPAGAGWASRHASGLKASGKSRSPASKRTTSFVRDEGTQSSTASARSPCGSTRASPRPAAMSEAMSLLQQRGLAHAGLADDGQVPPPVVGSDAEGFVAGAELDLADDGHIGFVPGRWEIDRRFKLAAQGDLHGRWRGRWPWRDARGSPVPRRKEGILARDSHRQRLRRTGETRNLAMRGTVNWPKAPAIWRSCARAGPSSPGEAETVRRRWHSKQCRPSLSAAA